MWVRVYAGAQGSVCRYFLLLLPGSITASIGGLSAICIDCANGTDWNWLRHGWAGEFVRNKINCGDKVIACMHMEAWLHEQ